MNFFPKTMLRLAVTVGVLALTIISVGRTVTRADAPDTMLSIAWSPDTTRIAMGYSSGVIQIRDAATGQILHTLVGHTSGVLDIVWNPTGDKIVTASLDRSLRLWNAVDGSLSHILTGHTDAVTAAVWNEDGSKIASGSVEDHNLRIWDANTGQALPGYPYGTVSTITRSPDGTKIAVAGIYIVAFLDPKTLAPMIGDIEQPEKKLSSLDVYALGWSPDSRLLATGHANGLVRVWDATSKQLLYTFHGNEAQVISIEVSAISAVAFNADGSKLFSLSNDGTLRTWDLKTGDVLSTTKLNKSVAAYHAAWSPYRGRLAFVGNAPATGAILTAQLLGGSVLNIVAPFASLDSLRTITNSCIAQPTVKQALIAKVNMTQLQTFVDEVQKLPKEQVSSACSSDLVAVATALRSQ